MRNDLEESDGIAQSDDLGVVFDAKNEERLHDSTSGKGTKIILFLLAGVVLSYLFNGHTLKLWRQLKPRYKF